MEHLNRIVDSRLCRLLAEPARVEILDLLATRGPMDIAQMSRYLPKDRSVISRHLTALSEAGLVSGQRRGRRSVYTLNGPGLRSQLADQSRRLGAYLHFWNVRGIADGA